MQMMAIASTIACKCDAEWISLISCSIIINCSTELFSFDYYSIYFIKLTFIYMYLIRRFYSDKRKAGKQAFIYMYGYMKKAAMIFYLIFKTFIHKNASIANMNEEQRLNCRSLNIYRKYRIGEEGKEKKEIKKS